MLPRMIAPSSLSAFASSVSSASQATRVAAPPTSRAAVSSQVQKPLLALPSGSSQPQSAPRGSLLDLSV